MGGGRDRDLPGLDASSTGIVARTTDPGLEEAQATVGNRIAGRTPRDGPRPTHLEKDPSRTPGPQAGGLHIEHSDVDFDRVGAPSADDPQ